MLYYSNYAFNSSEGKMIKGTNFYVLVSCSVGDFYFPLKLSSGDKNLLIKLCSAGEIRLEKKPYEVSEMSIDED